MLRDKRAVKSRRALIEAGLAELPENPMASLTEIAEIAGIGRATLYRHFASREALIEEVLKVSFEDIIQALTPMEKEGLRGKQAMMRAVELMLPLADRLRFLSSFWLDGERVLSKDPRYALMEQETITSVEQAKEDGDIRKELPTRWVMNTYDVLLFSAWDMIVKEKADIGEVTALLMTTFFDGVGPKPRETQE
ncbi:MULTISPECIES: TetR/AcrR family transcriptional regulator [Pseudovibrio]|uniref:TetR/AcrR family transcriptional regulator n=1 Tax=Pseudovibrio TaxID=258255 RepID=UPI0007B22107|nr:MULTISPECIES: TetR/AcrR family transcriptional regulator [Pseudovibrio]KZL13286.1 Bacterial regulatory protein, tetR family [Pseudovibrio sp. Ad26]